MSEPLTIISLFNLAIAFIPVFIVVFILIKWHLPYKPTLMALLRMLVQLLLVGYFLTYIFASESAELVLVLLIVMVLFSSKIALSNIKSASNKLYLNAFLAISLSSVFTLLIITQGVLTIQPWYKAQTVIPLAGMIFASAMNSVSLCGERFYAEIAHNESYEKARNIAFHASMIPNINALLAVGVVSLPGMMTGQILSGTSPFIAARYQIMVMCMIFASAGLASACFLYLNKKPQNLSK